MKTCPKCGQSYTDANINFCLNDGELLSLQSEPPSGFGSSSSSLDDSPPTMILDQARVTNPIGWNPPAAPPVPWQNQQPAVYPFVGSATPNQTLGIISLCLGAASMTLGWCCSTGLLLGPAAIIVGVIALVQNKKDPNAYGGKGFAWGGIGAGSFFVILYIIIMLLYGLSIFFGNLR